MRDPFNWSFPIGQVAGITVRLHILMPVVLGALVLREVFRVKDHIAGAWIDALIVISLLFLVILLHEFGHCFVARSVGGEAREAGRVGTAETVDRLVGIADDTDARPRRRDQRQLGPA